MASAFWSYVRQDDDHDEQRLSELRARLAGEVRIQTGRDFTILHDRNDIAWGKAWREWIKGSLEEVTFFIPILTPSYFNSEMCREEAEQFLQREKKLGRNDLVLPLYYVNCPVMNESELRETDSLAKIFSERNYADFRELRFDSLTSPTVGRFLANCAIEIRDAIE